MVEISVKSNKRVQSPRTRFTGVVGVTGMDTGRFSEFSLSLGRLDLPVGWEIVGALNYDENHARNYIVDNTKGDYIWFIDDDQAFQPDVLKRLLAHQLPVVAPLVLQRRAPFAPVAIKNGYHLVMDSPPGLIQVDLTGTSGMLIRREIFESLDKPYFISKDLDDGTHVPSDTNFCRALQAAGYPLWLDTGCTLAHYNVVAVSPRFDGSRWQTDFAIGNERVFTLDKNLSLWRTQE